MHSSVVRRGVFIFVALLVVASCAREGGKHEADKAKPAQSTMKASVTGTAGAGTASKKSTPNKTTITETKSTDNIYKINIKTNAKKTDFDINAIAQSQ